MKKSTQVIIALSSLLFTCSSALAGGVEMQPPTMWDFYIGGSGVAYGYENRFYYAVPDVNPTPNLIVAQYMNSATPSQYRNIAVFGGFDIGFGVWADRGYFGIEGRYDIGQLTAHNMFNGYFGFIALKFPTTIYNVALNNNAFVLLKIGYQFWSRTMLYLVTGWARATYTLSSRIFGPLTPVISADANSVFGTNQIFSGQVFKKSLNGGTVGIGVSHLLVDGLSLFAEFGFNGYHIPHGISVAAADVDLNLLAVPAVLPPNIKMTNNIISFNYYTYNLRVGINWSFASLI